jgi:hypothetical protein
VGGFHLTHHKPFRFIEKISESQNFLTKEPFRTLPFTFWILVFEPSLASWWLHCGSHPRSPVL